LGTSEGTVASVICLDGASEMVYNKNLYSIKKGDSYFLPPNINELKITKKSENFNFIFTIAGGI
jgi:mannose-6-phosphate isomerase class I